jgi:hypothetical protein
MMVIDLIPVVSFAAVTEMLMFPPLMVTPFAGELIVTFGVGVTSDRLVDCADTFPAASKAVTL